MPAAAFAMCTRSALSVIWSRACSTTPFQNSSASIVRSMRCLSTTYSSLPEKSDHRKNFSTRLTRCWRASSQIVLTCDRYPKEVNGLEERLKSRFGWGLTVAIEPPELETSVAILMSKADSEGAELPEEVAFFIAKRIRSNVRELEGALRRVIANSRFTGQPISLDFAKDALKDLLALAGPARFYRKYPENRCRLLQNSRCRLAIETAQPFDRPATANCDGPGQRANKPQPAGDRRCFWWTRPHDSSAWLPQNQCFARDGEACRRRLSESVENIDQLMWITRGENCAGILSTANTHHSKLQYRVSA